MVEFGHDALFYFKVAAHRAFVVLRFHNAELLLSGGLATLRAQKREQGHVAQARDTFSSVGDIGR